LELSFVRREFWSGGEMPKVELADARRLITERRKGILRIGRMPGQRAEKQPIRRKIFKLDIQDGAQPGVPAALLKISRAPAM
jgi:hypothetical protein